MSALWKYFVLLWPIYDRNSRSINPSIKSIKAIKKFSILEKKKDWDPCRSFHFFFFLNSTHQARLFSSILFKITKIFRMTTKVNSSYMHTRYSYLCVWTYEEESSNETISLGQYIDRRFKVLFIDYHAGTILFYVSTFFLLFFYPLFLRKRTFVMRICLPTSRKKFISLILLYPSSVPSLLSFY